MKRAVLIYNPQSGAKRARRLADVEAAVAALRAGGVEAETMPTRGPSSAGEQGREAAAQGCDAVIACGGDGTVNEILQGIAGTETALGVVPLGTGNALAHDLGLPADPAQAAQALVTAEVKVVTAGQIEFQHKHQRASRLFAIAAGIGADAQLMYELTTTTKGQFGMAAYYSKSARLYLTHHFAPFTVEWTDAETGERGKEIVSELLAVRITNFGGMLGKFVPRASLERDDLRLLMFAAHRRLHYPMYMLWRMLGMERKVAGVRLAHATEATCAPLPGAEPEKREYRRVPPKIYAEADGELLGGLPIQLTVAQKAYRLLVPRRR